MNTLITLPASVASDARNRAARTFLQGLAIDLATAAALVLVPAVTDIRWTAAYWAALGLSLARSAVQALVSYVARMVLPPPGASVAADVPGGVAMVAGAPPEGELGERLMP